MHNHENKPTRKSNQASLARVKKEMDIPRMTESAREKEEKSQPGAQKIGEAAKSQRGKESPAAHARGNALKEENNGKANHRSS
jgi:hypothetical protein